MTRPTAGAVGEDLYRGVGPIAHGDADRGWALLLLCGLLAQPLEEVDTLTGESDDGPGWSILLDVDRCPAQWLDFSAALIGVRLPPGLDAAQKRLRIIEVGGLQRGTPASLAGLARQFLAGLRRVKVLERVGSEWLATVVTYDFETPSPATVDAALHDPAAKPAGILLTHRVDIGWDIDELEAFGDIDMLEASFPDLDALERHTLGGSESWAGEPVPYGSFGAREGRAYRRRM